MYEPSGQQYTVHQNQNQNQYCQYVHEPGPHCTLWYYSIHPQFLRRFRPRSGYRLPTDERTIKGSGTFLSSFRLATCPIALAPYRQVQTEREKHRNRLIFGPLSLIPRSWYSSRPHGGPSVPGYRLKILWISIEEISPSASGRSDAESHT